MDSEASFQPLSKELSKVLLNSLAPAGAADVISDCDQIPLSFFMEQQAQKDAVWEWAVESVKSCTKIMIGIGDDHPGGNHAFCTHRIYLVLPFGYCIAARYDLATDNLFGSFGFRDFFTEGVTPSLTLGWFPEIVDLGISLADDAAVSDFMELYMRQYYATGNKYQQFGFIDEEVVNPNILGDFPWWYERHSGIVWEAARVNGILSQKSKKSMAANFNANQILYDLEQEALAAQQFTWAEIPGYYTGYLDNLGIYMPVGMTIDGSLSTALYQQYGSGMSQFVACGQALNTGEAVNIAGVNLLAGILGMYGGQAIGAMTDAYTTEIGQRRFLLPRVRSFGRQLQMIPSYQDYVSFARRAQFYLYSDAIAKYVKRYYLPEVNYYNFLRPLKASGAIPANLFPSGV